MAAVTETSTPVVPIVDEKITLKGLAREPLKSNGSLDAFESFDVTPVIGREFPNASLKDFLRAPNSDDLLRELSLTSSYLPRRLNLDLKSNHRRQSLNAVSSSSASKMVSMMTCRRSSSSASESSQASPVPLGCTSTQ